MSAAGSPKRRKTTPRRHAKNLPWDEWLTAWWGSTKNEGIDLHFSGPRGCDRSLVYGVFAFLPSSTPLPGLPRPRTFVEELEARGYDTTTIEFRVRRKAAPTEGT